MSKASDEYYDNLMEKVMVLCDNGNKRCFYLDFKEFDYCEDTRIIGFVAINVSTELKHRSIANRYSVCYNQKRIFYFVGGDSLKACFTIEIPYGTRRKYLPFVKSINALVDDEGVIILAVDNNPYHFQSLLIVETSSNVDAIRSLIEKYNLSLLKNKGLSEVVDDIASGGWNTSTIPIGIDDEHLEDHFSLPFVFAEEDAIAYEKLLQEINDKQPENVAFSLPQTQRKAD